MIKVALAQLNNSNKFYQNIAKVIDNIALSSKMGQELLVFPECFLTGFSVVQDESVFKKIDAAIKLIQNYVNHYSLSVALPLIRKQDEKILNSIVYLEKNKEPQFFDKQILTSSEEQYFSYSIKGPKVIYKNNYKIQILLCTEAEYTTNLEDDVDFVLWPTYWGWTKESKWEQAFKASHSRVHHNQFIWAKALLQVNYSYDEFKNIELGLSHLIQSSGELENTLSYNREELAFVNYNKGKIQYLGSHFLVRASEKNAQALKNPNTVSL